MCHISADKNSKQSAGSKKSEYSLVKDLLRNREASMKIINMLRVFFSRNRCRSKVFQKAAGRYDFGIHILISQLDTNEAPKVLSVNTAALKAFEIRQLAQFSNNSC